MLFHPLIRLLVRKPSLVAHHLGGYVELASAQAMEAARSLQTRLIWTAAAAAGAVTGFLLTGGALLIVAAVPLDAMPAPWLLLVVPGAPLLAGLYCWLQARQLPLAWSLDPMREQIAADAALLAEAERA